ncbi:MAG: VOC family protein [bacterium]|nr:VOC family protein [bacterium]
MSDRPARPDGMQWVNPYLVVKDLASATKFYDEAFGLKTRLMMPDEKGNPMHAELAHKDGVIMMGQEDEAQGGKSPSSLGGSPVSLYLYVEDVDAVFNKAKEKGAEVIMEPKEQFWGDKLCSVKCPEGYHWNFATNVADFDPSKAPGGGQ